MSVCHGPGQATRLTVRCGTAATAALRRKKAYEAELDRTVDAFEKRLQLTEITPEKKSNKLLDRQYRYHGSSAPIMLASVAAEHRDYELHEHGNSPSSRAGGVDSRFVWESVQRAEFAQAPDVRQFISA